MMGNIQTTQLSAEEGKRLMKSLEASDGWERRLHVDGRDMDDFCQSAIGNYMYQIKELVGETLSTQLEIWLDKYGDADVCPGCEIITEALYETSEGLMCEDCEEELKEQESNERR